MSRRLIALLVPLAFATSITAACGDDEEPSPAGNNAENNAANNASNNAPNNQSNNANNANNASNNAPNNQSNNANNAADAGEDTAPDVVEDTGADVAPDAPDDTAEDAAPDVVEDVTPDTPPDAVEDVDEDTGPVFEEWLGEPAPIPATPGLDALPTNATCVAPARPPSQAAVTLTPVFGALRFSQALIMLQAPGDNSRWFLGQRNGVIYTFDNVEDPARQEFVDLTDRVGSNDGSEKGLLGMAFSPDFATSGEVYISYTTPGPARMFDSRVSRFTMNPDGETLNRDSEEILFAVTQPFNNHNGGHIAFGPDGYLYFGLGDGGSGGDPRGNGQNTMTTLGALLRLDVVGQATYAIPADNPFADGVGGAPEIYAWGLRNPWRFSFDDQTGDLWLGDVGQNVWEEINLIERGGNYGWNVREGAHCYDRSTCPTVGLIDPIVEYAHNGSQASVTGGFVYRGAAIPALAGRYVFADFYSGPLFAIRRDPATGAWEPEVLMQTIPFLAATFAQDQDGELYMPAFDLQGNGQIYRLDPAGDPPPDTFPRLLSQTGCVDPNDPMSPAPGVLPYDLNVPFWSDGADKSRFLAIPDGAQAHIEEDGDLTLPPGSVLMKHFDLNGRRIETRLFIRHDDGQWGGYSYEWDEAQTDATLLSGAKTVQIGEQRWLYPSREQCFSCHNASAGFALGPEVVQLNRDLAYPDGATGNQFATLAHLGLLDAPLPAAATALPAPADPDANTTAHARAWLHANCAACHNPDNALPTQLDLRWTTPLEDLHACDTPPERGDLGVTDARIIAPGDPARSILALRIRATNIHRMPPLASSIVDQQGVDAVEAWIRALPGCP